MAIMSFHARLVCFVAICIFGREAHASAIGDGVWSDAIVDLTQPNATSDEAEPIHASGDGATAIVVDVGATANEADDGSTPDATGDEVWLNAAHDGSTANVADDGSTPDAIDGEVWLNAAHDEPQSNSTDKEVMPNVPGVVTGIKFVKGGGNPLLEKTLEDTSVSASVMRESCGGDCSVSVLLDPKGNMVTAENISDLVENMKEHLLRVDIGGHLKFVQPTPYLLHGNLWLTYFIQEADGTCVTQPELIAGTGEIEFVEHGWDLHNLHRNVEELTVSS